MRRKKQPQARLVWNTCTAPSPKERWSVYVGCGLALLVGVVAFGWLVLNAPILAVAVVCVLGENFK